MLKLLHALSGVLCRSRRAKNTRAGGEKWGQDKGIVWHSFVFAIRDVYAVLSVLSESLC